MSNNKEDNFHIGGRSYSKRELEEVAEHITRTDWRDHLPMVMRGPNGEETEITPSQDTIERIFNGVALRDPLIFRDSNNSKCAGI